MADDAIYSTARWRRLRRSKLQAEPLCQDCRAQGRIVVAEVVDHRIPISHGGDPFPALDGLRSLCWSCHSRKTARGPEAGAARTSKPRKGCKADGTPLDPQHPWNTGGSVAVPNDGGRKARVETKTQLVSRGCADG